MPIQSSLRGRSRTPAVHRSRSILSI